MTSPLAIQAYWWQAQNFGDCLTEAICARYGLRAEHAGPYFAQLAGVGSILEHLPADFGGYLFGSGFLHRASRRNFPFARILAARGPLTWERLGRPADCLLGDPGLLARHLLPELPPRRSRLGIVLHYSDRDRRGLESLAARQPQEVRLIDVRRSPLAVLGEIAQCEAIVSSSLHGLIAADAFQIPSAWKASGEVLGHGFKFEDHFAAVGSTRLPLEVGDRVDLASLLSQLSDPPPRAVRIAEELHDLCRELPSLLAADDRRPRLPWFRYAVAKVQRFFHLDAA
jgi:hypothetical protein